MEHKNKNNKNGLISHVVPHSIADEVGIEAGDRLLLINNEKLGDIVDFLWLSDAEYLELQVSKPNDEQWIIEVDKDCQESLGIEFQPATIDQVKTCKNNCIFCFVNQNPKGMRSTVTFRDDDYRLSFLEGNFITLNNIENADMERIIKNRMSPLYVSIHTTNPNLRAMMMGNRQASLIMDRLKELVRNGVQIHGQVVLCPGINDGEELERTLSELSALGSDMASLAVVPVGLTGFREGLTSLLKVDRIVGEKVLKQVEAFQEKMLSKRGERFVFPADEFFVLTGNPLPTDEYYEDYPQLANGVGLCRLFMDEYQNWLNNRKKIVLKKPLSMTMVVSEAAKEFLNTIATGLQDAFQNLIVKVVVVPSKFFGGGVTVAGLLTGRDLIQALDGLNLGDIVVFPRVMLGESGNTFLDDITPGDVSDILGTKLVPASGINDLDDIILAEN